MKNILKRFAGGVTWIIKKRSQYKAFSYWIFIINVFSSIPSLRNRTSDHIIAWRFSGYVIDGYTEKPLSGVLISYLNINGDEKKVKTSSTGSFFIDNLPFGERSFRFSYTKTDSSDIMYTQKLVTVTGNMTTSASEGDVGDVSKIIKLFPLSGALTGDVFVKLRGSELPVPARKTQVKFSFENADLENASPVIFESATDSTGHFSFTQIPVATGGILSVPNITIDNISYSLAPTNSPVLFSQKQVSLGKIYLFPEDSTDWSVSLTSSNVLSNDGFGLTGVPVNEMPYYVLSVKPDPASIEATIQGGGNPDVIVKTSGDTIFIKPVKNFSYNSLITVSISGNDIDGNRIFLNFDGVKQFRTVQGIFAVESNMWDESGSPVQNFRLNDTMWVKFSEKLNEKINNFEWNTSTASKNIYGNGANTNASVWVHEDTLFVKYDYRLDVSFGETVGFNVSVLSHDGKRSAPQEFTVKMRENSYFVKWTNTIDQFGSVRDDFGVLDSVIIVSSMKIKEVNGISTITDIAPPGPDP